MRVAVVALTLAALAASAAGEAYSVSYDVDQWLQQLNGRDSRQTDPGSGSSDEEGSGSGSSDEEGSGAEEEDDGGSGSGSGDQASVVAPPVVHHFQSCNVRPGLTVDFTFTWHPDQKVTELRCSVSSNTPEDFDKESDYLPTLYLVQGARTCGPTAAGPGATVQGKELTVIKDHLVDDSLFFYEDELDFADVESGDIILVAKKEPEPAESSGGGEDGSGDEGSGDEGSGSGSGDDDALDVVQFRRRSPKLLPGGRNGLSKATGLTTRTLAFLNLNDFNILSGGTTSKRTRRHA